jgi:hypothetical protein
MRVDLRNIKSPIIVFCSWGDDITPPQQALHWILDLYDHEDEIVKAGQTIVYCLYQSIGYLGIFVSGKVATKEHEEFANAMDMIDLMPPGLYEAVITGIDETVENPELVHGDYLFGLEARTLDDIRKVGGNSPEDELAFATAARVSEITQGVYSTLMRPAVSARISGADSSAHLPEAIGQAELRPLFTTLVWRVIMLAPDDLTEIEVALDEGEIQTAGSEALNRSAGQTGAQTRRSYRDL